MSEQHSEYAPGSEEELLLPPTDGADEARRRDWEDPAHATTQLDRDALGGDDDSGRRSAKQPESPAGQA